RWTHIARATLTVAEHACILLRATRAPVTGAAHVRHSDQNTRALGDVRPQDRDVPRGEKSSRKGPTGDRLDARFARRADRALAPQALRSRTRAEGELVDDLQLPGRRKTLRANRKSTRLN